MAQQKRSEQDHSSGVLWTGLPLLKLIVKIIFLMMAVKFYVYFYLLVF